MGFDALDNSVEVDGIDHGREILISGNLCLTKLVPECQFTCGDIIVIPSSLDSFSDNNWFFVKGFVYELDADGECDLRVYGWLVFSNESVEAKLNNGDFRNLCTGMSVSRSYFVDQIFNGLEKIGNINDYCSDGDRDSVLLEALKIEEMFTLKPLQAKLFEFLTNRSGFFARGGNKELFDEFRQYVMSYEGGRSMPYYRGVPLIRGRFLDWMLSLTEDDCGKCLEILEFVSRFDVFMRLIGELGYNGEKCVIRPVSVFNVLINAGETDLFKFMFDCAGNDFSTGLCDGGFDFVRIFKEKGVDFLNKLIDLLEREKLSKVDGVRTKSKGELYGDPDFYVSRPEFPEIPLSVDNPHSFIVEGATGCAKASEGDPCKFCTNTLKSRHFKSVSLGVFINRLHRVLTEMSSENLKEIRKIFLSGADLLAIPKDKLLKMLWLIKTTFTGSFVKIEGFANVPSVLKMSREDLVQLKKAGLTMLYIGGETGDDVTLETMNKGQTKADVIAACKILGEVGIETSCFVMPGLGGYLRTVENAWETADMIEKGQPDYVNVLPLTNPPQECVDAINADPYDRLLTPDEIREEILRMVRHLREFSVNSRGYGWRRRVRVQAYDPDLARKAAVTPLVFRQNFYSGQGYLDFKRHSEGLGMLDEE